MTRTEAIEWLTAIRDKYIHGGDQFYDNQRRVAIDYAVTVLKNIEQPPKTNADRIRAMSDEELADMINNFDFCSLRTNEECRISYCSVCSQCVLDWLRDPVPVEGGPTDV